MSPQQLIEKLEDLGIIDPKMLKKIRQEIDNPDKTVRPKAVLRYLVKKDQITQSQADRLLGSGSKSSSKKSKTKKRTSPDTNELMGIPEAGIREVEPVVEVEVEPVSVEPIVEVDPIADHGATVMDAGQFVDDEGVVEVDPIMQRTMEVDPIVEVDMAEDLPEAGVHQDFGGNQEFADYGQPESQLASSFSGKRNLTDQWSTKWLYIGFGILGFLVIMGAVLAIATSGVKAEDQFDAAMDSFKKNNYADAIAKFERYIEENPKHKYVPSAEARRVQCIIAAADSSKNWNEAITTGQTLLPELAEDEESKIEDIRDDLGVMLPRALFHLTEKAKKTTDLEGMKKELTKLQDFKKLVDNPVYIPPSAKKKPLIATNFSKIENNIRYIEGQINKEIQYNAAISQIDQLGAKSETDKAFATYKKLIRNYGDLAVRDQLRTAMRKISAKEGELVNPIDLKLNLNNAVRPSPIESSVVLATRVGKASDTVSEIVTFLADGSVYGINAGTGEFVWRKFVGYETTLQPEQIDENSLLISDQKHNDVMIVENASGKVVWRAEVGEPFLTPAFSESHVFVTTETGKVIKINRVTGQTELATQLPQRASVGCMPSDRHPLVYQVGHYSNLYVLSDQDFTCRSVHYIGHYTGSIVNPPVAWSGYILVLINGGDFCDLQVLRPGDNGLEMELIQSKRLTNAPVSSPIQKFGRWRLLTADNGEIRILELDPTNELSPIRTFAEDQFENRSGQPAYVLTEGSNMWIAGQGVARFRIKRAMGTFERDDIVDHADTFLTPLRKLDDSLFHVRRRQGSGMITASLVDAKSLEPVWRSHFGGKLVGPPLAADNSVVAVSNQGDLFGVGTESFAKQYEDKSVRASPIRQDLKFEHLVSTDDDTFACFGSPASTDFLFAKGSTAQSKLRKLTPPADHIACRPISIGKDIIVPSISGNISRINPQNGRTVGTPFMPPTAAGAPSEWFEPVKFNEGVFAIAAGNGANDQNESFLYFLDASDPKAIVEVGSLKSDDPFKSRLVSDGKNVFGVVETATHDQLAVVPAGRNPEIKSQFNLPGRVVGGPWLAGSDIVMKMDNDQLILLGTDGATKWSIPIANDSLAGAPQQLSSGILLTFQSGKIVIVNPSNGEVIREHELGQPIIHQPTTIGNKMYFSGMDGTIHRVDVNQLN